MGMDLYTGNMFPAEYKNATLLTARLVEPHAKAVMTWSWSKPMDGKTPR
jgi:hypothetical protein